MDFGTIRKMSNDELELAQHLIHEEIERRENIESKVAKINELLYDLMGDLTSHDTLDILHNQTGQVMDIWTNWEDYNADGEIENMPNWAAPLLSIRLGK